MKKIVNGVEIEMTSEEVEAFEAFLKSDEEENKERELALFRHERNRRLADCDWTQSRDVTLSNDDAWKAYREALRRLPETTDPSNPTWPEEPK